MRLERVGPNWIRGANFRTAVRKSKAALWPDVCQHPTISRRASCGLDQHLSEGAMMASRTMVKRRFRYSGKLVSV